MVSNPCYLAEVIAERTSWCVRLTLQKPDGAGGYTPITLAELSTLTLTLYNLADLTIINGVNDTDVKNVGRGALHATSGVLTLTFDDADSIIATASGEYHVALIEATYNSGTRSLRQEVIFAVRDLAKVPT